MSSAIPIVTEKHKIDKSVFWGYKIIPPLAKIHVARAIGVESLVRPDKTLLGPRTAPNDLTFFTPRTRVGSDLSDTRRDRIIFQLRVVSIARQLFARIRDMNQFYYVE